MGQPVRILDLATDLIKLSGLKPGRDIESFFWGAKIAGAPNVQRFSSPLIEMSSRLRFWNSC
jgi:hypothetical protein